MFCCHGGGKGKIFPRLKTAIEGNEIVGEIDFRDPLRIKTDESVKRARKWAEEIAGKF